MKIIADIFVQETSTKATLPEILKIKNKNRSYSMYINLHPKQLCIILHGRQKWEY